MADIQERIGKIKPYFKGMQVTEVDGTSVIYVMVSFPPKWIVDDNVREKYDVDVINDNTNGEGSYYFCTNMETGFDVIFNAIDYCIGTNKDAMERAQLFQEKINELKEIFANGENTIKKLKTLEFTFARQKKDVPRKKSPVDEVAEKELEGE